MELFDFESDEKVLKTQEDPAISKNEDGQSLLQLIVMIVAGIVLVILLVLFARWIYHKVHHTAQITTTGSNQQAQNAQNDQPSGQPVTGSQPSAANSKPSTSTPSTGANGLPNSGPGNVVALFAASSIAAAGLHFIISLRRFNKE